jgi:hypothetical protein
MKRILTAFLITLSLATQAGLPPTSSKVSGESSYPTTFKTDYGTFTGTRSGTTLTITGLGDAKAKSLDIDSYTTAQMLALTPVEGQTIYNSDYKSFATWNGTTWTYGFGNLNVQTDYVNGGAITIEATTTNPTKGSIVTDRVLWKRNGQNLRADYQYEQGAGGAGTGDYLFTLPAGLQFDSNLVIFYTGAITSQVAPKSIVGYGNTANNPTNGFPDMLIAYDATRFRVAHGFQGFNPAFLGSSNIPLSGQVGYGFTIDAPISGWSSNTSAWLLANSNPSLTTTDFSAKVSSADAVSDENIDFINGNCTNATAGRGTCTYITSFFGSSVPNCVITPVVTGAEVTIISQSSSAITYETKNSAGTATNSDVNIKCQRSGSDFLAANSPFIFGSFAGVLSAYGYTGKVDHWDVSYGATSSTVCAPGLNTVCPYIKVSGGSTDGPLVVGSEVKYGPSGGVYEMYTKETYSEIWCQGIVFQSNTATGVINSSMQCSNCNMLSFRTLTANQGSATDTWGSLKCTGYR